MKPLKIFFVVVPENPTKTLALFILVMLTSILSGQDIWKNYTYSELSAGVLLLDGDTLWMGSDKGLAKLNTVSLSNEIVTPDSLRYNAECIAMDKQKNIWMGTRGAGLIKFNGKSWTVFNNSNSGLPDNLVGQISIDKLGNVWIGTGKGLAKFDGKDWKTFNTSNSGLLHNEIRALCVDNSDNLWTAGDGKLYKFDGTSWKTFDGANWGYPSDNIISMVPDSLGKLWIATMYGLYTFDGTAWGKIQVPYMGGNLSLTLDNQENVILLGTNSSYIYSRKTSTGKSYYKSGYYAVPDPKGYIWWTNGGTLFKIKDDFSSDVMVNLPSSIPAQRIVDFAFDSKGNTLLATNVGIFSFEGNRWTRFQSHDPNSKEPTAEITSLAVGKQGELWVGTGGDYFDHGGTGLYLFDGTTWKNFNKSNSGIKSDLVRAVAVDHEGNVWVGTYGGGLLKYDGTNWLQYCPYNEIFSVAVDSNGVVWAGTDGGLFKFEGSNAANFNVSNAGLPGNCIYSVYADRLGNIWFLSTGNSDNFHGTVMKFDGLNFSKYEIPVQYSDYMTTVAVDEKGNVWEGHSWNGIYRQYGSSWSQIKSNVGIKIIRIDKYGNKWIAYGSGFSIYNEFGIVSEVEGEVGSLPKEYSLTQNYPNPFNPSTNISYSIPEGHNVKLIVYNMLGKEVSTLVDEYKSAGNCKVNFNASHLPSGVYIYTIQAGEFRDSRKLMLLK